jgi:Fic family protein
MDEGYRRRLKMFNPDFRYTNKIVRLLTKISALRDNTQFAVDSDRPAYYRALQSVDQKTLDLTDWLEYFAEGVAVSIDAVKERVVRLSSERLRKAKRGQIALTERQMQMVEFINQNGKIAVGDVSRMFKITRLNL